MGRGMIDFGTFGVEVYEGRLVAFEVSSTFETRGGVLLRRI